MVLNLLVFARIDFVAKLTKRVDEYNKQVEIGVLLAGIEPKEKTQIG